MPLLLGGMAVAGYVYTARQLTWRIFGTFVFLLGLQLLRSMLQRLLLLRRRAISIQQAQARRAAEAATREQSEDGATTVAMPMPQTVEPLPDIAANAEQSQRLLRTGLIAASLVGVWIIWVDVLPALRILDRWPVWTTTVQASADSDPASTPRPLGLISRADSSGEAGAAQLKTIRTVTVADIGSAILIAVVTIICARNIPGLMQISVLNRLPLDNSTRYAATSLTSYAIVLVGVVLAFHSVSIGWSKVQWLATALTFGLAFGLQEIFANFVAGLILLFEQPIRVGDVITVDETTGIVSRIRIRATTITNWDRKEYVIPNKEFITGRLLNWTLSDNVNRIVINVGIAYGSDVDLAKRLLTEVCTGHPAVLTDPAPVVTFEGFGDSSLNLVVRTYLPSLDNRLEVIDQLHTSINRAFHQAGIEIAFPQTDLHVRSIDQSVWKGLGRDGERRAA